MSREINCFLIAYKLAFSHILLTKLGLPNNFNKILFLKKNFINHHYTNKKTSLAKICKRGFLAIIGFLLFVVE